MNSNIRCFFNCKGKTCNDCINKVRKSGNPSCPTCRRNIRQHPLPRPRFRPSVLNPNYSASRRYALAAERQRIIAAARRARNAVANSTRGAFQEPPPALINRMYQRSGSTSPPPRVTIRNPRSRANNNNNNNDEPRQMHTGGLVRKTGPHRLLKDEIVLSRAQRRGLTHGQIVKILKSYKKSK